MTLNCSQRKRWVVKGSGINQLNHDVSVAAKCDQAVKMMAMLVHWDTAKHITTYWKFVCGWLKTKIWIDDDKLKLIRHYRKVYDWLLHLVHIYQTWAASLHKIKFIESFKCIYSLSRVLSKLKSCVDGQMYDTTACALGRGSRCENTVCDLRRWLEDGVQEAVYCNRKQVRTNLLSHVIIKMLRLWIHVHWIAVLSCVEDPNRWTTKAKRSGMFFTCGRPRTLTA